MKNNTRYFYPIMGSMAFYIVLLTYFVPSFSKSVAISTSLQEYIILKASINSTFWVYREFNQVAGDHNTHQ